MTPDQVVSSAKMSELGLYGGINEAAMRIVQVRPGLFPARQGLSDTRAMTKAVAKREAQAELARYEMDQVLGHDTVPDVVEYGDEQHAPGSVFMMRWVDECGFGGEDVGRIEHGEKLTPRQLRDFARITVLDSITGNTDRHEGNYLVDRKNDRVWAIDSGFGQANDATGLSALRLLGYNLPGIKWDYDPAELRREFVAAAREVRAKLPQILEIAGRRLGRDAAENISAGLNRFEDAVSPAGWAETRRRW